MADYITLQTARAVPPDITLLLAAVKTATGDPTAVLLPAGLNTWRGKKATAWSPAQITATQALLDTTAASTPQLLAQRQVDAFPIEYRALVLALVDQLNVVRALLPAPLSAITPAQAIAAIRTKAGTL